MTSMTSHHPMKSCLLLLGILALALVIVPPCIAFGAGTGLSQAMKSIMLVGTLLWFATATPLASLRRPAAAATPRKHQAL